MQVLPVKRGGEVYCPFVIRICMSSKSSAEVRWGEEGREGESGEGEGRLTVAVNDRR